LRRVAGWTIAKSGASQSSKVKREIMDWGILGGSIGPRVRLLRNTLNAGSLVQSEPYGLPTGSLTVMSLIAANPGCSQVQLAALAGITGPSLVGIIAELEERGLLSRERDSADRRRNMVVLTDDGREKMATLFATVTVIEQPVRDALGPDGMAQLIGLLDRALAALAPRGPTN
jgi:DNA-binding MarR family transcriptional regulator